MSFQHYAQTSRSRRTRSEGLTDMDYRGVRKIDAEELLGIFVDSFTEDAIFQLQTLTAVVKLFLKRPDCSQPILQRVLDLATKCDSPDARDGAYIYWRLLSTDSGAARAVVMAHKPPISLPRTTVSPAVLEELIGEIGSLASVYHKPAETFVGKGRMGADSTSILDQDEEATSQAAIQKLAAGQQAENLLDFDDAPAIEGQAPTGIAAAVENTPGISNVLKSSNPLDDLVSIFGAAGAGGGGFGATAPAPLVLGGLSSPVGERAGAGGGLEGWGGWICSVALRWYLPPLHPFLHTLWHRNRLLARRSRRIF